MQIFNKIAKAVAMTAPVLALAVAAPVAVAQGVGGHGATSQEQAEHQFGFDHGNVLQVVTRESTDPGGMDDLEFVLSHDEVRAGWVTIRHINATDETHSIYLTRVPDAQAELTREEFQAEVTQPFQEAWGSYFAGEQTAEAFAANVEATRPGWFGEAQASGGVGLLGGQQTGWTTINLQPGTYFLESRTLDESGNFGANRGLVERLVVTEEDPGVPGAPATPEPEADIQVTLSSTEGLQFDEQNIQPGPTTIEVIFEDNIDYGDFGLGQGHDLHLIRLDEGTTIEQVSDWVDFLDADEGGFYGGRGAMTSAPDAPGPQTFRGGVGPIMGTDEADFPQSSYMHVNLTPGRYALVSRTANPGQPFDDNPDVTLLQEFSVTPWVGLEGAWFDPETQGQGWNFVSGAEGLVGFFYGYNDAGENIWLVTDQMNGELTAGESFTFDVLGGGTGGTFESPVPSEDLEIWGEVTFTFESCDEATAELSGMDGTQTQQLIRLSPALGMYECAFHDGNDNDNGDNGDNGGG